MEICSEKRFRHLVQHAAAWLLGELEHRMPINANPLVSHLVSTSRCLFRVLNGLGPVVFQEHILKKEYDTHAALSLL